MLRFADYLAKPKLPLPLIDAAWVGLFWALVDRRSEGLPAWLKGALTLMWLFTQLDARAWLRPLEWPFLVLSVFGVRPKWYWQAMENTVDSEEN